MVKMYFTTIKVNNFFLKNLFFGKLKIYNLEKNIYIYNLEDFRQGVSSLDPLTVHQIHWSSPRGPRGFEFASTPPWAAS